MEGETASRRLLEVLGEAKRIAKEYYALTGRPLGITGEMAEYEAIRLLGLRVAPVRQAGFDAEGEGQDGHRERLQIKGRCIPYLPGKLKAGERMAKIDLGKPWDAVLLVIMNADFDAVAIFRAERVAVQQELATSARTDLPISKFKKIGRCVWAR